MDRAPTLPDSFTDGAWRQVRTQQKDELTLPVFSVRSHSRLYEHTPTAERLAAVSGADLDMPPRAAFTTALVFDPSFADLGVDPGARAVFAVARRRARSEFARSVQEDGLVDVDHTESRWLDRADGRAARAFRYDVTFPLDPTALDGGPPTPTLRGVLWAAVWPTETAYAMAGGIYPAEPLATALDRQGATLVPGVDVTVDVDRSEHRRVLARAIQEAGT